MNFPTLPLTAFAVQSGTGPLSADHRRELSAARDRARVIRKTARVASFNGWSTAIIAACSAPFSLSSPVALALTVGLAVVAFNEFRGRKRLLNFEPSGATLLGWNQLFFLAMITAYCLWMIHANLNDAGSVSDELKGYVDLDATLGSANGGFASMYKQIVFIFYGAVIGLSALFQGGTALYYFSRRRHVEDYVAETPTWVRDVQRDSLPA